MAANPTDVTTKKEGEAMCEFCNFFTMVQVIFQAMTFVVILITLIVALIKATKKK